MKYLMTGTKLMLAALLLAAVATPQNADAQFNRLKERAKKRAQDRLTEHAERKVDQAVDKVVDEAVARTENQLKDWVTDAFDGDASVSEDGVLSRKGQDDIKLVENEAAPASAEYLSYITVTEMSIGTIPGFSGMTSATEFYLHGNTSARSSSSSTEIMDLDGGLMTVADHKSKTYFQQSFEEMAEMVGKAMDNLSGQMDDMNESMEETKQQMKDNDVKMDFDFSMDDTGNVRTINGLSTREFVSVLQTKVTGQSEEGEQMASNFYTVTRTFMSPSYAGSETLDEYGKRMAQLMQEQAAFSTMSQKMEGLSFLDSRIGESMKKSSEEMAKMNGLPVRTVTYMVSVPEDQEFDVDKVFSSGDDIVVATDGGAENDMQRTILKTTTYISNLSGKAFDESALRVSGDYKLVDSPLKMMSEQAAKDQK